MPAKGDGITKRKDGRYMARYTIHTPDGPRRKTIYGSKYREVEKKLNEARGDAAKGLTYDAGSITVGEYLDRWLADSVRDTVRRRTYERYESIVRVHLKPILGRLKLKALTPAHVRGRAASTARSSTPGSPLAASCTSTARCPRRSSRPRTTA
jgi:integrase